MRKNPHFLNYLGEKKLKKFDINIFRAKDWYRLGEETHNERKRITYFKNAVGLDPLHGPAWHFLGFLYSESGDKQMEKFCNAKALEAYKNGLQRYRRELTREEWEFQNQNKKDDEMKAMPAPVKTYDVISDIDEKIDNLLENLGRLYCNMNELEKAQECYDKLIDMYPNWVKPHKSRGLIRYRLGNTEKAIDDLRFAIEVDENDFGSHLLLGKCYKKLGLDDRALWYFRKANNAADSVPNDIEAKEVKGDSSFELENYEESISAYQYILEKNPKNKEVWKKIAGAHLANGECKQAKRCFEKVCRIQEHEKLNSNGEND
ncbi:MAG: tetratricopeptide repeat protein [Candidatus Nitrosotenuis sp.]